MPAGRLLLADNRIVRVLVPFLAASVLFAQAVETPTPVFTREGILPPGTNAARHLAPGNAVELYGRHLAPEPWCGENNTPPAPYPAAICGVQVLVGTIPAELLYVGTGQINFKIPAGAPAEGALSIQVCVRGACGDPVVVPLDTRAASLHLRGTAAVHMPVWIEIDAPPEYAVRYPCADTPWNFDGYQFEVRRNGQPLVPATPPKDTMAHAAMGGPCRAGAQPSPLPLHLLYDLDRPGVYSVRFTAFEPGNPKTPAFQSDWTDITVAPFDASQRDQWLQSMAVQVKSAPPETLIANVIPSLLAWPDEKALTVLLPLLALPAPVSTSDRIGYAGQFARYALAAFSDEVLRTMIPPDRMLSLCPPNGRCRAEN
jgi:hypothetical protein